MRPLDHATPDDYERQMMAEARADKAEMDRRQKSIDYILECASMNIVHQLMDHVSLDFLPDSREAQDQFVDWRQKTNGKHYEFVERCIREQIFGQKT